LFTDIFTDYFNNPNYIIKIQKNQLSEIISKDIKKEAGIRLYLLYFIVAQSLFRTESGTGGIALAEIAFYDFVVSLII
jgi:hypothetical protein